MSDYDTALFIGVARQQGYDAASAGAALAWVRGQLRERGLDLPRFYVYRSGAGGGAAGAAPGRPRLLLAFPSADAALGFAQRRGLGASPRLLTLGLGQALAALLQRPAIGAALFADEGDPPAAGLPVGLRLSRAELIGRLLPPGEFIPPPPGEKLV